ncbi:TonB-dependent receptor [Methylobacterium brachiatum]|jgi:iron complex outermembrane receptor protein|uniref:Iron complex outermembrane receptor protein n=1 Tax=Methylobacterium brachiatum TaxID=269660 RepID=A0AAJ1TUS9_9HYPH|nr:TonB-dependent receptor [Methylobacterium brachiatum]MCB4803849.1 TonB-dependent receptor [Methylobacterium brachiatum]MDF2601134.1 TonB-dependent receptor plug [Methylobacterium brachiatum]MDH2310984.1 TonB-dependent receptor [Methylobacterium brachiatum]MDQ0545106.1 iron complex outermembrane receptor protein [Methylobacterium brachiatum]SFJ43140.1 iron complex outermembrane recepter protein [Methylobacterium brachiatum]
MTPTFRHAVLAGTILSAPLSAGLFAAPAQAQKAVALDEISVTSPSPIQATKPVAAPAAPLQTGILPVATNTFSPVTVVTQDQIARDQPRTLGDALFDRPGISSTTYAPGAASRPIIRGLDNARVRIQENGIVNGGVSDLGEDHAVPVNPLVADRIEVIRGPATLRYGSGAIGGVVSADNNRVPTFIPANGVQGQVTTGFSSVDNGRLGAATVDAGGDGIAVHADGFRTANDSYAIPGGIQRNSYNESQGGAVGISAIGDRGFVGISFSHYDAIYAIPGGTAEQDRTRLTPNQDRVLSRGEYRPLDGPFEVIRYWAGYSVYRHNEVGIGEDGIEGVQAIFKNREAEGRLELQHVPVETPFGVLTGALGFQSDRRVINTQLESFLPKTESRANAVYLFEELELRPGTRLQAAGRYEVDRLSSTAAQFPTDFTPVDGLDPLQYARTRRFAPKSASIGALQDLPFGFVASLNGSYVERGPTGYELFSQGPHDATATFEIGNPDLKKERARTVEASIRRAEGPLRLDATGYYTRYTGFIYRNFTGLACDDDFASCGSGTENRQVVYQQQNATFYGAEIIGQYDVLPVGNGFAGIEAQFDFVRAQFDNGTNVPRIPPYRLGGGVYLRADGWFARVNLLHAFDHQATALFETPTPGYDDLRAELSYTKLVDPTVYGASAITLGVQGRNLLDADIRNSTSFKKDEILLPGRNVRLFLTARF